MHLIKNIVLCVSADTSFSVMFKVFFIVVISILIFRISNSSRGILRNTMPSTRKFT